MRGPGKGKTNNPEGKPKGTPNKITGEMREFLKKILEKELGNLPHLLNKLSPEKKAEIIVRLLPFVLPKINDINIEMPEQKELKIKIIRKIINGKHKPDIIEKPLKASKVAPD